MAIAGVKVLRAFLLHELIGIPGVLVRLANLLPTAAVADYLAAFRIDAAPRSPNRNPVEAESQDRRRVTFAHSFAEACLDHRMVVVRKCRVSHADIQDRIEHGVAELLLFGNRAFVRSEQEHAVDSEPDASQQGQGCGGSGQARRGRNAELIVLLLERVWRDLHELVMRDAV